MSFCNVCKYQLADDSVKACPNCGAVIEIVAKEAQDQATKEDTPNENLPEGSPSPDNIEICDPGTFIGAAEEEDDLSAKEDHQPIGQTTPPLPPQVDSELPFEDQDDSAHIDSDQLKKLSPEQAAKIRSAFNTEPAESDSLTPEDASSIMNQMASGPEKEDKEPSDKSRPDLDRIIQNSDEATIRQKKNKPEKMTSEPVPEMEPIPSVRRVAYFHKSFIQLTGPQIPKTGEELILEDRHYLLKPKKIKQQYTIATFVVALAILLFYAGSQFISPTLPGAGSIVGVLLDVEGRPFASSAEITLPEAGQKSHTDAMGFFRFNDVATGSYVIRYQFPDGTVGTENISVVSSQITTLSLGLDDYEQVENVRVDTGNRRSTKQSKGTTKKIESTSPTPKQGANKKSQKSYSSLKLKANVDDARLTASGSVLGSGNLTYKKLMPGKHQVMVSKNGYKAWKGTVTLKADKTYTLSVNLEKIESPVVEETTYSAMDFYQSGKTQLAEGNMNAAVDDFTEAIKIDPQLADAYRQRGDAYRIAGNNSSAEKDLIRGAELMASQNRIETAHEMYAQVLSINKKSTQAYLGQASLYMKRNNLDKAISSYKSAIQYDKKNFKANFALGKTYFSINKNKYADKWLTKARNINPDVPEVYHYLMLNYFARDDFGKVKNVYTKFKSKMSSDQVAAFKANPKFEPIIRVVGEYERP
ncbi:MAG: tetratricopeptide repeat protein [FCB group bacterium]|nr:tetratricopeptide repeat protein [FCB group bacterium]